MLYYIILYVIIFAYYTIYSTLLYTIYYILYTIYYILYTIYYILYTISILVSDADGPAEELNGKSSMSRPPDMYNIFTIYYTFNINTDY